MRRARPGTIAADSLAHTLCTGNGDSTEFDLHVEQTVKEGLPSIRLRFLDLELGEASLVARIDHLEYRILLASVSDFFLDQVPLSRSELVTVQKQLKELR